MKHSGFHGFRFDDMKHFDRDGQHPPIDSDTAISDSDTDTQVAPPMSPHFGFDHRRPPFGFDSDVTVVDSDTDTQVAPPMPPHFGFDHRRPPFGFDSDVTIVDSDTDTTTAPPEMPSFGFDRPDFDDIDDDDDEGRPLFNFNIERPQFGADQEPWFAREDNFVAPDFDDDLDSIISEKPFEQATAQIDPPFDIKSLGGKNKHSFAAQGQAHFDRKRR